MVVWGVFGIEAPVTDEDQQEPQEKLTRRERRAQAKAGDTVDVRDRNQRLRSEAAATRKQQRAEERAVALDEGLGASERVDDALARSVDATGKFVKNNFIWLQWLIVLGAGAAVFALIMRYRNAADSEKQGHVLASVLSTEFAKVPSDEPTEARDPRLTDTRTEFSNAEERDKKALEAWSKLTRKQAPEVLGMAQLAAAHAKYDLKQYDAAKSAYEELIKNPKLAPEIKARALEGVGFVLEAQGNFTGALAAFQKMDHLDDAYFKRLGRFHSARAHHLLGQNEEAKKLLSELNATLSKDQDAEGPRDYLGAAVRDLLRTVDPVFAVTERQELEKKQAEEQSKRLQEMIAEMQKKNGKFSMPGLPGSPAAPKEPASVSEEPPLDLAPAPEMPDPTATAVPSPAAPAPVKPSSATPVKPTAPVQPATTQSAVPPSAPKAPSLPAPVAPVQTAPTAPVAPAPPVAPTPPTAPAPGGP